MAEQKHTYWQSPLGWVKISVSDKGLHGIRFVDRNYLGVNHPDYLMERVINQLTHYFAGQRKFLLPLVWHGTPFQLKVWHCLLKIPYGTTITYKQLADWAGHPKAARAIGTAVGANPFAIVAPCHRVIRSDGGLGGYAYGLDIKKALLQLEGVTI